MKLDLPDLIILIVHSLIIQCSLITDSLIMDSPTIDFLVPESVVNFLIELPLLDLTPFLIEFLPSLAIAPTNSLVKSLAKSFVRCLAESPSKFLVKFIFHFRHSLKNLFIIPNFSVILIFLLLPLSTTLIFSLPLLFFSYFNFSSCNSSIFIYS